MGKFTDRLLGKKSPKVITLEREFRCSKCGRIDRYEPYASPQHCGVFMDVEEELLYSGGDPEEGRLDVIDMVDPAKRRIQDPIYRKQWDTIVSGLDFELGSNDKVYEIWFLRPGRYKGEKIGWVVETPLTWKWQMVPGVATRGGACLDQITAVDKMISALDEG
jgi:hypothetical protein